MPTVSEALQRGWARHQSDDVAAAERIYRQVLQVAPTNENAWCFLGMVCHDQGRYEEAVEAYEAALRIKPEFPVALSNLGNTLKQQGKLDESVASCRKALQHKPDYSTAYNNLGVALVAQGELDEAAASFDKALVLMPDDAVAHANLGAAQIRQGRFDEGTAHAQRALRINPNYAEAHKNQAIVWLLLGQFERGWQEYEWRWKCPGSRLPEFERPRWDGSSLDGRTILLYAEQGLGDTIHFVRYAKRLRDQGARTTVASQKPLLRLLSTCEGIDELVSQDDDFPPYDVYAPLLSVPGILGTTLDNLLAETPYLSADAQLSEQWRHRLEAYPGFRVGIAWQGSPDFHADRQRSVPLTCFESLAGIPGVRLFSLQKGPGVDQIAMLHEAFEVIDFGDELDGEAGPFMDTMAIMKNMDLIVTSDTSIPHLAGALDLPVWMALSVAPDWRWLLERDDSPWYPSMRLFRQQQLGDWEEVFARIADALRHRISPASEPASCTAVDDAPAEMAKPPADTRVEPHHMLDTRFNSLVQSRYGFTLFNRNDIYIGRSLDHYGEYSEGEVELLRPFLEEGDTVVEVGANIGAHTLPLAKIVGSTGVVHAFEPQRVVFQTLCANVALNSLDHVHCRQAAVGAVPGHVLVPQLDYGSENNFGGLGLGQYHHGEKVPVMTLDQLQLHDCRLIKIDVEGMERSVLEGAAETITRRCPLLYLENDRQEQSAALIEYLMQLDYQMFWHLPPLFNPKNFFQQPKNVFGNIVSVNMLAIPASSSVEVRGLRPVTGPDSTWQA
ncbi:MAG: FkbM family methyltransferase [Pirellulaceae bacterium]